MGQWVALLYSVVIAPDQRVRSADLIRIGEALRFGALRTVLSTGNLIFAAPGNEDMLARRIEAEIFRSLGKAIPVLLRCAADWRALIAANPFQDQTATNPGQVAVRVMRHAVDVAGEARLQALCRPDEGCAATDRALWVVSPYHASPSPLLRAMAAPKTGVGTFRNVSAIGKIAAALDLSG